MTRPTIDVAAALCFATLCSCVLPSFQKVDQEDAPLQGQACGLSDKLPKSCDGCIRAKCCELAQACSAGEACAQDMIAEITPAADFSRDFEPLLGCMQSQCGTECEVDWGCVDDYSWPSTDGPLDRTIAVTEFVSSIPIEGVEIRACSAMDPTATCRTGRVAQGTTDSEGNALLRGLPPDFDGLYRFSADGYLPATLRWSEPVHRVTDFSHFVLSPVDLAFYGVMTGVHKAVDEPFDPDVGHMIVRVQNCLPLRYLGSDSLQATAANVEFRVDEVDGASPSQFFYTEESNEVSVSRKYTSHHGFAGAFNFPPYNIRVTATEVTTGLEVASGRVQIVAGGMGFLYLAPRARP
jgi:hypothetical protein